MIGAMKANVPTNPNSPDDLSCTNYDIHGSDENSKILENRKFLRAWTHRYNTVQYIKYMYITWMVAKIKSI